MQASCSVLKKPTGFLDLPTEIRTHIYCYDLVACDTTTGLLRSINLEAATSHGLGNRNIGFLTASKQISEEALDVLYGENTFEVPLHGFSKDRYLSEENRKRIRKLQVVLSSVCTNGTWLKEIKRISPILSQLTRLSIVAEQPTEPPTSWNRPRSAYEQELRVWIISLREVVEVIVDFVPASIVVEFNDKDMKETGEVLHEYFPAGFEKVSTLPST